MDSTRVFFGVVCIITAALSIYFKEYHLATLNGLFSLFLIVFEACYQLDKLVTRLEKILEKLK